MATFDFTPSYPLEQEITAPGTAVFETAAGYSSRIGIGLHPTLITYNLSFNHRSETEKNNIVAFLRPKLNREQFDFTAPGDTQRDYYCVALNVTREVGNLYNITATFEESEQP